MKNLNYPSLVGSVNIKVVVKQMYY